MLWGSVVGLGLGLLNTARSFDRKDLRVILALSLDVSCLDVLFCTILDKILRKRACVNTLRSANENLFFSCDSI